MARNSGIEFATGEYITFCDSDDYVDLETYETVYQICKKEFGHVLFSASPNNT